jgi:hypothetical protein
MPEHLPYEDDSLVNRETHHEKSDVNVRALLIAVVVFILFAIVTHILLYFMFKFFVRIENGRTNAPLSAVKRPAGMDVPAEPRLQPFPSDRQGEVVAPNANTPVTDMEDMRANEEKAQTTYGWIDQPKGIVRLPIEQAKQLLLQRGLPVVAAPVPSPVVTTNPGSSGGQMLSPVPATTTSSNSGGQAPSPVPPGTSTSPRTGQAGAPVLHTAGNEGVHP